MMLKSIKLKMKTLKLITEKDKLKKSFQPIVIGTL